MLLNMLKLIKLKLKLEIMKKIRIPFDLSKIDKDTRIETKNGYEVEILKTDLRNDCPIVGVIKIPNQPSDFVGCWTI